MEQAVGSEEGVVTYAVCAAAKALGLKRADFAQILGVSEPTIARLKNSQSLLSEGKSFELSVLLIRVYRALYAIVGGDADSLKHWIKTPNHHFQGKPPVELMKKVEGMALVIRYLDAMRGRM